MNTSAQLQPILIDGQWRESTASGSFQATNPQTRAPLEAAYPISTWADCERVLEAATRVFEALRDMPTERIAHFLTTYAERIEQRADAIVELANLETALPVASRL